jgi:16S rRNA (guanine966-N2)-methyltransferase
MRIIGGKLKGKKIFFLDSNITRPLRDLVKESIFNIINHSNLIPVNLENSNILDLYSGIGSFGIECISRGAKEITFVENDVNAIQILKKNLHTLKLEDRTYLYTSQISSSIKKINNNFDVIFLDPPFVDHNYKEILAQIKEREIFKKKHIIILHRDAANKDELDKIITTILTKKYGRSKIIFGVF